MAIEQRVAAAPTELPIINVLPLVVEDDASTGVVETGDHVEEYTGTEDDCSGICEELGRVPGNVGG